MCTPINERERILDAFRRWGYLESDLDPLGSLRPQPHPELRISGGIAEGGRAAYCGTLAVEFMHIPDPVRRRWIQERMESKAPEPDSARILQRLIRACVFERVMHSKYPGTKRFSLEGLTAVIPLLDEIIDVAADRGAREAIIGMSHRGRLNVMVHIVGTPAEQIFTEFEDADAKSVLGGGDVKYHIGATGEYRTRGGRRVHVRLVSNPSHLEAVDPVALGRARAKQTRVGRDGTLTVLPILLHGDAAFAGQGIAAETLNLADLDGYSVGGTLHVIMDNLIGFTAKPAELHSSRFASDVAKRIPIPILHVNGEDPDSVVRAGRFASDYRYAFGSDVIVDLIGYRRHGHSEVDDPTITHPLLYRKIKDHPPLWEIYASRIGIDAQPLEEHVRTEYEAARERARGIQKKVRLGKLPPYWSGYSGGKYKASREVDTGVPPAELRRIGEALLHVPDGFNIHPKVRRLLDRRLEMIHGSAPIDFPAAEALAFATLLKEGVPIRLTGQDSQRGTFGQRHAVLIDVKTEAVYVPLRNVEAGQALFEVYNTMLSEVAVLGFEYGFSRDYPDGLVLWEAQFGDFANGAQVIIDQFISAGEDKWGLLSGLVLLLPHGYEGQGPEHSSARIERYLQLAGEDNMQICQPSTAAQYFHLLRRQALRTWRKPLIVFTPKSMLRHPDAASSLGDLSGGRFREVIPDLEVKRAERILVVSGKIGHELYKERKRLGRRDTGILFVEQLYPFPEGELATACEGHPDAREIVWVQEEPGNMGALAYILPKIEGIAGGRPVRSLRRSPSASPATGSLRAHELEQKALLSLAFPAS